MILKRLLSLFRPQPERRAAADAAAPAPAPAPASPTLAGELAAAGQDLPAFLAACRSRRLLPCGLEPEAAQGLAARFPDLAAASLRAADQALAHEFDLLGSGPFTSRDPGRPARADGYAPLDWVLDPVRGLRFPAGVPHKEWSLYAMRPGDADVKYPWELARCQHFAALGQAFRLTGDGRYAQEIADQIQDFLEANPPGLGIHYTCTMDAAIRAANWAIGLELAKTGLPDERLAAGLEALFGQAVFVFANFEDHYEVTSNHYLSNLVGLAFAATPFAGLPAGRAWLAYCRERLEEEITKQILPDGADFESSLPYHRLVLELFLGAARLFAFRNAPLSADYHEILGRMAGYLLATLRPDGRMPVLGDADDGRLHVFTDQAGWDRQDGLHILAPAGLCLGRGDLLAPARERDLWEAAWWGFEVAHLAPGPGLPPSSALFPEAGVAVYRSGGTFLAVTNAKVGTEGFGNHKHNDQLSFELHLDGTPLIVDPGSFVYTADFAARNRFRATASHSTLMVDGAEQNEMNPEWIFRLFETARAEHLFFRETDQYVEYAGLHHGYQRLPSGPLTHARCLRLLKAEQVLLVLDCLEGAGRRRLSWSWRFAPGVAVEPKPGRLRLTAGSRSYALTHPEGLAVAISPASCSPSYGIALDCVAADMVVEKDLDGRWSIRFALGPGSSPPEDSATLCRDAWPHMETALAAALRARARATTEAAS